MENEVNPGFFARLGLAFKLLGDAALAGKVSALINAAAPKAAVTEMPKIQKATPPEKAHASGLFVLSVFQQEGRLVDFLQQDIATFSDEEVGSATRVVHGGCRKALERLVTVNRIVNEDEGAAFNVPVGFNSNRISLTGNVTGQPPYKGILKHHGWAVNDMKFPTLNESIDYRVLAPAEVEL
ncbi:MAG TPA: DUF2760 domain-containing protein [Verrucomicrobiae bacterium]|nr:DUF2760 domain-containing protein [Verrucomicrobiae bacterium]